MASVVYALCAVASLLCAFLLLRGYRATHAKLLLWKTLGFFLIALNNVLLVVDKVLLPDVNMAIIRILPALLGMVVILVGLVWHAD
jgi:hypothetical protein